ncbi:MAG TPA: hypothetical protein VHT91_43800 [Kofleriaceae bacterium]|jgi:hypothetical protein|nr:hypothetical protein [Kofleriaceae bacterium]
MKNLVLGALLAAAVSSTACGTTSDTSARITARWSFNTFANHMGTPNGACPDGYGTTAVYVRPWDPFVGDFTGPALASDLFDCADLTGTTDPLDGIFQVWIQVETDDATTTTPPSAVYVTSGSVVIDTADGNQTIEMPPVYTDAGYMDFGWKLQQSGAHVHCADVGVHHNGIASIAVSPSFMLTDKFDCEDGFGTTDVLAADTYLITVTATNTAGVDVGASGPIDNVQITPPNGPEHGLTSLGNVTVSF